MNREGAVGDEGLAFEDEVGLGGGGVPPQPPDNGRPLVTVTGVRKFIYHFRAENEQRKTFDGLRNCKRRHGASIYSPLPSQAERFKDFNVKIQGQNLACTV